MNTYGNNLETIKHVSKVGLVFFVVTLALFSAVGYANGNIMANLGILVGVPAFVGLLIPALVALTAIFNIETIDDKICLLIIRKYRFNIRPINMITSINIGRGLFTISFEDGTAIRTLGMYIPEYSRLVKDIKSKSARAIDVKSNWLYLST